eukprot:CAMPEP_0202463702 /NCGR_PEP_ID=MMETSP1360-20130828/59173_1 /ASSEMBLY_ACC=CAM_ASM_000848 /TAXON_ID=515479 /ORGANISM="Licmophora paradoxa, Strain CCMP2313" /LENGTH=307 /DNA_ID=CAMNT_0049086705 /DNA_START=139 /DNA_END=1062 /DNA_ORIENTATION=-
MRFASPLQALTIWDSPKDAIKSSPRKQFLERYRAGLAAEKAVHDKFAQDYDEWLSRHKEDQKANAPDWAKRVARYERRRRRNEAIRAEQAYDGAVARVKAQQEKELLEATSQGELAALSQRRQRNSYQIVGVIDPKKPDRDAVQWFARKKPKAAKWSLRLIHVNRDAIIKDLFDQGKVDIMAKYKNKGYSKDTEGNNLNIEVKADYAVKERSWRTLWNFSPKHFFTDSSGMYWRERRLRPGVYTDGADLYQTTYRYNDGRNGLRLVDSLGHFLNNTKVDDQTKTNIQRALAKKFPDIVMEGPVEEVE